MQNSVNDTSIAAVIEIDKKARAKVSQAQEEAQSILKEAKQKKANLLSDYTLRSDKQLETAQKDYKKDADEKIARLEADKAKRIEALSEKMNANKARWEKQILSEIIGE